MNIQRLKTSGFLNIPLIVKRSPPVVHDPWREAGTLQWVRRAFACCFPVEWETFLGAFWEPGVGLAPGAGLCMLRASCMALKHFPTSTMARGDFEEGQYRVSLNC